MNINKVYLDKEFTTKEEVFQFLAEQMQSLGIVDNPDCYVSAVQEREKEGTTGLVNGFAIPHGKSKDIKEAAVLYVRNRNGIEWDSLDGSLITDIFALAIPETATQHHLDSLIAISTNLMDDAICNSLRATQDEDAIRAIFD